MPDKQQKQPSSRKKWELIRAAEHLLETAGEEDWDGEGALAVPRQTVETAKKLAEMFPESAELPEVSASPHGEVDFDWFVSRDIMLTVSVCPTEQIAYAGIFNGEHIKGAVAWTEGLPLPVASWLESLEEQASARPGVSG